MQRDPLKAARMMGMAIRDQEAIQELHAMLDRVTAAQRDVFWGFVKRKNPDHETFLNWMRSEPELRSVMHYLGRWMVETFADPQ